MGRPGGLPPDFVPSIQNQPVDHERAANAWLQLEQSTEPPLPHPRARRSRKRPSPEEPSPPVAVGRGNAIQGPAGVSIAPSRSASSSPSRWPDCCGALACGGPQLSGRSRARRAVRVGVPLVLQALILWLLSYSGFQHDFLRVSSNDQSTKASQAGATTPWR